MMADDTTSSDNRRTQSPAVADDSDGGDVSVPAPQPPPTINLLHYILNMKKMELSQSPEVIKWLKESQQTVRSEKVKTLNTTDTSQAEIALIEENAASRKRQSVSSTSGSHVSPARKRFRSLSAGTVDDMNFYIPCSIPTRDENDSLCVSNANPQTLKTVRATNPAETNQPRLVVLHPALCSEHDTASDKSRNVEQETDKIASSDSTPVQEVGVTERASASTSTGPWTWSEGGSAFTTVTKSNPTL